MGESINYVDKQRGEGVFVAARPLVYIDGRMVQFLDEIGGYIFLLENGFKKYDHSVNVLINC